MKKLVYHLYVLDGFDNNPFAICNKLCLKNYINVFDDATFFVSVDDIHDMASIRSGIRFIEEVCGNVIKPNVFVVKNNKELGEATTFNTCILPMIELGLEDYVFFGHCKGMTTNRDHEFTSLLKWVIIMYYYNLEFIYDVYENFYNGKILYGSNLSDMSFIEVFKYFPSKTFYSGTFYWLNVKEIKKYYESTNIDIFYGNDLWRYYAEEFPLYFFNEVKGSYKNNVITNPEMNDTYKMNEEFWNCYLLNIDDELKCVPFINEIIDKVININKK